MDSLDFDVHKAALASLARLKSNNSQQDLDLWLDRIQLDGSGPLSIRTLHAISTLCTKLVSSGTSSPPEALERLRDATKLLPSARIERAWDVSAQLTDTPLLDSVSHDLVQLWIASAEWALLQAYIENLTNALLQAQLKMQHNRIATHLLPLLQGLGRAAASTSCTVCQPPASFINAILESSLSISHQFVQLQTQEEISIQVESSADAAYAAAMASYYQQTAGEDIEFVHVFAQRFLISLGRDFLARLSLAGVDDTALIDAWPKLLQHPDAVKKGTVIKVEVSPELFVEIALDCLEPSGETSQEQAHAFEAVGCLSFETATLVALANNTTSEALSATLKDYVSATSSLHVQETVLHCLQLLLQRWPALAQSCANRTRGYLLAPNSAFALENGEPSEVLVNATRLFARSIQCYRSQDAIVSAIYSVVNLLPVHSAGTTIRTTNVPQSIRQSVYTTSYSLGGRSLDSKETISGQGVIDTVIYVVSVLASAHFTQLREVGRLAISVLIQRLRGSLGTLEEAVLAALVRLGSSADVCTDDEFSEIVKALAEYASSSAAFGGMTSKIVDYQHQLALAVAHHSVRAEIYATELLNLFVNKALARTSTKQPATTTAPSDLISLLSVLSMVLQASPHLKPESYSDEITAAFRELWFLCTTTPGLSADSRDLTIEDRLIFARIAQNTPCLINGAGQSYVETDLEYDSVLRRHHPGAHKAEDVLRKQLATSLPQHAGHLRSITYPQVVFLLTVLRIESLRASSGTIGPLLSYFDNEGVNKSSIGPSLEAVGHQVASHLNSYIQSRVSRHCLPNSMYRELCDIATACCHTQELARSFAGSFFNSLVVGFPSILCSSSVMTHLLELLTLLHQACESRYTDMYYPTFEFKSKRIDLSIVLTEDGALREHILTTMLRNVRQWITASLSRTPVETQNLLQEYIDATSNTVSSQGSELGRSVALDMARVAPVGSRQTFLPNWAGWKPDAAASFTSSFRARQQPIVSSQRTDEDGRSAVHTELRSFLQPGHRSGADVQKISTLLYETGSLVLSRRSNPDMQILRDLVAVPFSLFTKPIMDVAIEVWSWVINKAPSLEAALLWEVQAQWTRTVHRRRGFFSASLDPQNPMSDDTEYAPTDKPAIIAHANAANRQLAPHTLLLEFLSSRFQAIRYRRADIVMIFKRLVLRTCLAQDKWSQSSATRELRCKLCSLALILLQGCSLDSAVEAFYRKAIYAATLSWFKLDAKWSYGGNQLQLKADVSALKGLRRLLEGDFTSSTHIISSASMSANRVPSNYQEGGSQLAEVKDLIILFITNELQRLEVWDQPLADASQFKENKAAQPRSWKVTINVAWDMEPALVIRLLQRFSMPQLGHAELQRLLLQDPEAAQHVPEMVPALVASKPPESVLRTLLFWRAITPVLAITFFLPEHSSQPLLLQYAMRVLEQHPVSRTFFYIPQIVQGLRTDDLGYVERFIFEAASISQLFCHQIIWNMRSNFFKDDNAEVPDPMKDKFEHMSDLIVRSLDGEARAFYQREFDFFAEVTSISKKLQPFIKKSKPEKKAKIDEEMSRIKLDVGVYLPSNPDGIVVDIDRLSGRPLQSHAKAPFMATFRVRKALKQADTGDDEDMDNTISMKLATNNFYDVWQAAMFKVGDDCRQDMLALQVIAQFKNIFTSYGLDLHLIPYRVTATGPGQGVIDVVPNATSRDEMGRAKVNDLPSFFHSRFGAESTIAFQKARNNFVQSMAGYSVLCYILQIKDRHNGNIMIDGDGHITHVDFGFLFDIGPGGIKFEPNSFKLTHEMVDVMGGVNSPGFRAFKELAVKAFLACRPFVEEVCATVKMMMATDLPSFTGEGTIDRLRDRFKPHMTEVEAAHHMRGVIANAQFSQRSILYDRFQEATNGIPYAN